MSHFRSECRHGTLVTQCRCISPDKETRIVPCPSHCRANRPPSSHQVSQPPGQTQPLDDSTPSFEVPLIPLWKDTM